MEQTRLLSTIFIYSWSWKNTPKKKKKAAKVTVKEQAFYDLGNTVQLSTKSLY